MIFEHIIFSLDRGAYSTKDKISLMVNIDNQSAVDVTGSTVRVSGHKQSIILCDDMTPPTLFR